MPLRNRQIVRRLADIGAGIIDENVQSTVMLERLRDQRVDRGFLGDIDRDRGGRPAARFLRPPFGWLSKAMLKMLISRS